jgi:BASS family bile acid:Na+ symporter
MLHVLAQYAVPLNLVLLMLVAGTEIRRSHLSNRDLAKPVFIAALGQLLLLPPLALAIIALIKPHPVVGAGLIILALSPGGGISNTYCYLARCSVLLSALMTAAGTVLCLLSIPLWLQTLPQLPGLEHRTAAVPAEFLLGHLFAFMIVPLLIGAIAREVAPQVVDRAGRVLRMLSLGLVALILATTLATVAPRIPEFIFDITTSAVLFIVLAMCLGAVLGRSFSKEERNVIIIESCVRNIAVALVIGTLVLRNEDFALLATFLAGYLAVEIAIMLPYAGLLARGSPALHS